MIRRQCALSVGSSPRRASRGSKHAKATATRPNAAGIGPMSCVMTLVNINDEPHMVLSTNMSTHQGRACSRANQLWVWVAFVCCGAPSALAKAILQTQKSYFFVKAAGIPREAAVGTHDTMTRHHNTDGITPDRTTDCASAGVTACGCTD